MDTSDSYNEAMEVDEESDESQYAALIVEPKDLQNLSIPYDDEEGAKRDSLHGQEYKPSAKRIQQGLSSKPGSQKQQVAHKRKSSSSRLHYHSLENMKAEPTPSTSAGSGIEAPRTRTRSQSLDPEDEIRRVTALYLQGEISVTDFAAAMEDFELYKVQQEAEERQHQPSLILLNPDTVDLRPHIPEVILMEADADAVDEESVAKLRGEFFRTGDDPTTFSVRRKRKMPPTIKSMMGEAHVRFARGDLAGSESICLEVIKEQPTYKDPFHTLAMIYENQGRVKKSLQFFLISGLLDPKHFDDWPRLAELSVEAGNLPQGIMCLSKAIVCDPSNIKAYLRRSELMTDTGDHKGALRGYSKVLHLSEHDGTIYMDVAKKIAAIHFQCNEVDQAYEALSGAVNKFSDKVTTAELNLLTEVCISLKRYVKAVTLFMRFSGVRFEPAVSKTSFKERNSLMTALNESKRKCLVPIGLHADLVQKLCIVLIHLEAFEMVKPIVTKLNETESIESFGLQFYEIAEAYLAKQQYEPSLTILTTLVNTEKYSMAEIWLRYAECLFLLNRVEDSAEAYSKVIKLAPGHKIARLNLSVILQKLGRYDVALESLDQNEMEDLIDQDLLVEKCNILLSRNRLSELYETALQLFSRHCPKIRNHDEAHALVITSQTNQMLEGLKALRVRKGDASFDDIHRINCKHSDNPIGEWTVYLNLYQALLKMNRPDLINRLVYTVWASPLFGKDERMKKDMDLHAVYASILNSDADLTPYHMRALINMYGLPTVILNMMSLASRRCGHDQYRRQILRLLIKRPNDTRLMMLSANNSFMNGTYKYALMEYLALVQHKPTDPLIHLMIASTLLHITSQKQTGNRSHLMIQAIAFINKYAELRGECQEVFYNLGRFYHYMGLFRQAMSYYKRVLITEAVDDRSHPDYNISDLKREAAFNIAQIYKASNCWQLAKRYIHRYVVI